MNIELLDWDIQDSLNSSLERQAYFEAALEEAGEDPLYINQVLGDLAKSYGISKLAQETGLTRTILCKAFGKKGNPSFATVIKVATAMDLKLTLKPT